VSEDNSALPICCASISNFRSAILAIQKNDGEFTDKLSSGLLDAWDDLCHAHGPNEGWSPIFLKFLSQAELTWPTIVEST
jgi:hypothetical protein